MNCFQIGLLAPLYVGSDRDLGDLAVQKSSGTTTNAAAAAAASPVEPRTARHSGTSANSAAAAAALAEARPAGAYTRPPFGSTYAHFVGYVGCMISPQSIRQGDTGRCDQNGLG
jgi:hypothetical protein